MYPFLHIFNISIPTYGLCMLAGVFLVAFLAYLKGKPLKIPVENIILIMACVFGGALIAGWLFYLVVTYSLSGIFDMISKGDFSFMKNGGIVFYGGLIGGLAGGIAGKKIIKTDLKTLELLFVPYVPLGHAIGRVGCFLAGCCYGMEYSGPLAVYYPHSLAGVSPDVGYFPVQLLEAFLDVLIFAVLWRYCKKERKKFDIISVYLALYSVMRFGTECLRGDAIRGVYFGLSTSQWISIGIIIVCVVRFVLLKNKKELK